MFYKSRKLNIIRRRVMTIVKVIVSSVFDIIKLILWPLRIVVKGLRWAMFFRGKSDKYLTLETLAEDIKLLNKQVRILKNKVVKLQFDNSDLTILPADDDCEEIVREEYDYHQEKKHWDRRVEHNRRLND